MPRPHRSGYATSPQPGLPCLAISIASARRSVDQRDSPRREISATSPARVAMAEQMVEELSAAAQEQ